MSMNKSTYIYPVILEATGEGYVDIHFPGFFPEYPDTPISCNVIETEALSVAKEQLALTLAGILEDNENPPMPIPVSKLNLKSNQSLVIMEIDLSDYSELIGEHMEGRHWHIGYYENGQDIEAVGYKGPDGDWEIYLDDCRANNEILFRAHTISEAKEKFYAWVENRRLK